MKNPLVKKKALITTNNMDQAKTGNPTTILIRDQVAIRLNLPRSLNCQNDFNTDEDGSEDFWKETTTPIPDFALNENCVGLKTSVTYPNALPIQMFELENKL
ncbi:hypothetical protein NPIL_127121 [Nephila pilipes]|uniref:Uncharacterized protein n=1 Tax=Nephila pilipes TaxID=299642 RepID=A0A8X6QUT5_NEPPI|nr:hypothetical protein NPIL_127121 [Nephila pilipes]